MRVRPIGLEQTDNTIAAFNISRESAAVALAKNCEQDPWLIVETIDILRVFTAPRSHRGSNSRVEEQSINRYVSEQKEQDAQMIYNHHNGQLDSGTRLFASPMEGRTSILPSFDSTDLSNAQQSKRKKCSSSAGDTQLAIPILVSESDQAGIKQCQPGEKRRRFKDRRSNKESNEASLTMRNIHIQTRSDPGEEFFEWIISRRQFNEETIQLVIDEQHRIWSRHRQRFGGFEEFWTKFGKSWEDLTTVKDPETVISNLIAKKSFISSCNYQFKRIQNFCEIFVQDSRLL
ncbi:MAG: hypothetical protein EZS28_036966 [Streblomastix strix]|uniref:Uncharacterized protein n=1 Tax=Streblomastix strix TaxID=222440 RepID=A0A5J4UAP2_9EUKA|nr:MAG: hypothetical protein EZS28_036966 [Streblomastix strix]